MAGPRNGSISGSPDDAGPHLHHRMLLCIALALPVARLFVYLPWPLQYPYHSIPFLAGISVVSAMGVTQMTESRGLPRAIAIAASTVVILCAAAAAQAQASRYFALRRVTDALVSGLYELAQSGRVDSMIIAVPHAKAQAWWGLGPTLSRFAAATERPLPRISERPCEAARADALAPRQALVVLQWQCESSLTPTIRLVDLAHRVRIDAFTIVVDTLQADVHMNPGPPSRRGIN
ncbi:MAG TPA: hypothetical protein VGA66_17445 [Mycobacterium sp.]